MLASLLRSCLAASLAAVLCAASAAHAQDQPQASHPIQPTRIVYVPMSDGVKIAAAIYLPSAPGQIPGAARGLALSLRQ